MKSYADLNIYRESKRLAVLIHEVSLTFPKYEMYEEGSQLRRSSKSVTALIVEGYGRRRFKKDYVRYMVYSLAECDEVLVHLDFVYETKSLVDTVLYSDLKEQYISLAKSINKFITWLEKNDKTWIDQ